MKRPRVPPAGLVAIGTLLIAAMAGGAGCSAVVMTGHAVATTVSVTADVAAASVRGVGKVAAAAVGASGEVADESIKVAAKLSKSGMVVFFDPKTGTTWEAPVKEGLQLLAAAQTAKVDAALSVARVIRGSGVLSIAGDAAKILVKSGDVVELLRR